MSGGKSDVRDLARIIHRCPEGYEGPCWGPTAEDRARAKVILAEQRDQ